MPNIDKIISAVNHNPDYINFVPLAAKAWGKFYGKKLTLAYVRFGDEKIDEQNLNNLKEYCDGIHTFNRIEGIDYGVQSKVSRMYIASLYESSYNLIVDIDMIPLDGYFAFLLRDADESSIVKWNYDYSVYQTPDTIGKWPMDKTSAYGKTFKNIINKKNLDYEDLLKSWTGFKQDARSNIFAGWNNFSDESLLRCLWDQWDNKKDYKIPRSSYNNKQYQRMNHELVGRLDRAALNNLSNVDINNFFECHGPHDVINNKSNWYDFIEKFIDQA